jgi:hypothetical protein
METITIAKKELQPSSYIRIKMQMKGKLKLPFQQVEV